MAQKAVKAKNEQGISLSTAFSSFSIDDAKKAKQFYSDTLGISVEEQDEGLQLTFDDGPAVFLYQKEDHEAATFTVLNFPVDDIEAAVTELKDRGVKFEVFEGEMKTDENDIFRGSESGNGPDIAWFKDPAGNFLSIIEQNTKE